MTSPENPQINRMNSPFLQDGVSVFDASPIHISPSLTIQPPLSRRGTGHPLVLIVDANLDSRPCYDNTPDPPPLQKWAEESYAVAQISVEKETDSSESYVC